MTPQTHRAETKRWRWYLPAILASLLFGLLLGLLELHGLRQNHGTFVYPLDDAYIHLALSRNLALHGVWGITPFGFSGASSSPGWTLLLALTVRLFGVHLLTPLLLNAVAAIVLLFAANFILAFALPRASVFFLSASLCLLVLVTPLPGLAAIAMEHVLQSLAILALVGLSAYAAASPKSERLRPAISLGVAFAAFAAGALRYESCFAIAVVLAVLLLRRRLATAIATALGAAIGPVAYGVYSFRHSGLWLPFSVVMKSAARGESHNAWGALASSSVMPMLVVAGVVFFLCLAESKRLERPFWTFAQLFQAITLATLILHLVFGPVGWLMRYESYLYALGSVSVALGVGTLLQLRDTTTPDRLRAGQGWQLAALAFALLIPALALLQRIHHGWTDVAESMHDRYVEHLPQALFVRDDLPHGVVIANDIGFLAFYAPDLKILDPLGLGSIEPVRLERAHGTMDPAFMRQWATHDHAQLAILHTDFPGMDAIIPAGWVWVESWCFPHNLVFQNHIESFYVPDAASAAALGAQLDAFHQLSPEIVRYHPGPNSTQPPTPERGVTAVCPAS